MSGDGVLQDDASGSEVERLYHLRSADNGRQQDGAKGLQFVGQYPQGFEPGQSGHAEVQQQDVRPQRANQPYRLLPVSRFTNDIEPWVGKKDIAHPDPHQRVIIRNHDSSHR